MKHAGPATLAAIEPLLGRIRASPRLVERTPGSFYCRSRAFLHFHEDALGTFADVRLDGVSFERLRVSTPREQARLLDRLAPWLLAGQ